MADLSFRGIPYTGGIADPHVKQVLDAVIENLRRGNLSVAASGLVYSGGSSPTLTPASQLSQLGGGARLGIDFNQTNLRVRTIVGSDPVEVSEAGNTVLVKLKTGFSGTDNYTVKVRADLTDVAAGSLAEKLYSDPGGGVPLLVYDFNPASTKGVLQNLNAGWGVGIAANTPGAGSIEIRTLLAEGQGITLTRDEETGYVTIDSDAVDHKVCLWGTEEALPQDTPGFLLEKLTNNGLGDPAAIPILGIDYDNGIVQARALLAGPGMAIADADPDADGLEDILVSFYPDELPLSEFDWETQYAVMYDSTLVDSVPIGPVVVPLGEPAGLPFETGDYAGDSSTVARGNHTHEGLPTGGAEGDVWYHDGDGWINAPLATLVAYILWNLGTMTPTAAGHKYLVKDLAGDGTVSSFGWGPLRNCS